MLSRRRTPTILVAVYLAIAMGAGPLVHFGLSAVGPYVTDSLQLSATSFGALWFVLFGVATVVATGSGRVSDGRSRLLLVVVFLASLVAVILASSAPTYILLVVAVAFAGIAQGISNPATNVVISTEVSESARGLVIGVKQSGVPASQLIVGLALPPLAIAFGWRIALLTCALVLLGGIALTAWVVPRRAHGTVRGVSKRRPPIGRAVQALAFYAFAMGVATQVANVYLPLYLHDELDLPMGRSGLVIGVLGATGFAARLAWGLAMRRNMHLWRHVGIQSVGVCGAVLAVLYSPQAGEWLVWLGACLFGVTALAANVTAMVGAFNAVPPHDVGRASSWIATGMYAGYMAGPVTFGSIVDGVSFSAAWWALLAMMILLVFLAAWAWRSDLTSKLQRV